MNRTLVLIIAALLSMPVFAVEDVVNPFESYHNEIAKVEKKLAKAGESRKADYQKKLSEAKKNLEDAVLKRKKPFEEKLEKYQKSLEKTTSKNTQKKYEEKIASCKKSLEEIDAWASGSVKAANVAVPKK